MFNTSSNVNSNTLLFYTNHAFQDTFNATFMRGSFGIQCGWRQLKHSLNSSSPLHFCRPPPLFPPSTSTDWNLITFYLWQILATKNRREQECPPLGTNCGFPCIFSKTTKSVLLHLWIHQTLHIEWKKQRLIGGITVASNGYNSWILTENWGMSK